MAKQFSTKMYKKYTNVQNIQMYKNVQNHICTKIFLEKLFNKYLKERENA